MKNSSFTDKNLINKSLKEIKSGEYKNKIFVLKYPDGFKEGRLAVLEVVSTDYISYFLVKDKTGRIVYVSSEIVPDRTLKPGDLIGCYGGLNIDSPEAKMLMTKGYFKLPNSMSNIELSEFKVLSYFPIDLMENFTNVVAEGYVIDRLYEKKQNINKKSKRTKKVIIEQNINDNEIWIGISGLLYDPFTEDDPEENHTVKKNSHVEVISKSDDEKNRSLVQVQVILPNKRYIYKLPQKRWCQLKDEGKKDYYFGPKEAELVRKDVKEKFGENAKVIFLVKRRSFTIFKEHLTLKWNEVTYDLPMIYQEIEPGRTLSNNFRKPIDPNHSYVKFCPEKEVSFVFIINNKTRKMKYE